jgi:hypothetical protein
MTSLERFCFAFASVLIAGCASAPEDIGDPNFNAEAASQVEMQNLKSSQHNRCIVLGTLPGTDAFDDCLENLATADALMGSAGDRARSQSRRLNAASSQPVNCKTMIVRAMPKTECF